MDRASRPSERGGDEIAWPLEQGPRGEPRSGEDVSERHSRLPRTTISWAHARVDARPGQVVSHAPRLIWSRLPRGVVQFALGFGPDWAHLAGLGTTSANTAWGSSPTSGSMKRRSHPSQRDRQNPLCGGRSMPAAAFHSRSGASNASSTGILALRHRHGPPCWIGGFVAGLDDRLLKRAASPTASARNRPGIEACAAANPGHPAAAQRVRSAPRLPLQFQVSAAGTPGMRPVDPDASRRFDVDLLDTERFT